MIKKQGDNEENFSDEESEEISNDPLIDTIVAENRRDQMEGMGPPETLSYEKTVVNAMQIIPSVPFVKKATSYLDVVMGQPLVTELPADDITCQHVPSLYSVQSPDTSGGRMWKLFLLHLWWKKCRSG